MSGCEEPTTVPLGALFPPDPERHDFDLHVLHAVRHTNRATGRGAYLWEVTAAARIDDPSTVAGALFRLAGMGLVDRQWGDDPSWNLWQAVSP